ncbi:hypothetical protein EYF80_047823 [Liparis tanakae]|uniref:Uncharacterized protein n=1 Tax=Liparis tanakae TaxID=230148 RepID=A0A4Z2FLX2_9TELE|nr:hypothetical protein EYF80_047823 [Liparis tanakae]
MDGAPSLPGPRLSFLCVGALRRGGRRLIRSQLTGQSDTQWLQGKRLEPFSVDVLRVHFQRGWGPVSSRRCLCKAERTGEEEEAAPWKAIVPSTFPSR